MFSNIQYEPPLMQFEATASSPIAITWEMRLTPTCHYLLSSHCREKGTYLTKKKPNPSTHATDHPLRMGPPMLTMVQQDGKGLAFSATYMREPSAV